MAEQHDPIADLYAIRDGFRRMADECAEAGAIVIAAATDPDSQQTAAMQAQSIVERLDARIEDMGIRMDRLKQNPKFREAAVLAEPMLAFTRNESEKLSATIAGFLQGQRGAQ